MQPSAAGDALRSGGREAVYPPCDVRDYARIEACVDFTLQRCGSLDVLVNNVGGAPRTDAATASPRFSEAIKHLNLLAPLNFSQVANRVMQGQEDGDRIINSASVSTLRPALLPTVPPRPVEPICAGMGSRYTPPIT